MWLSGLVVCVGIFGCKLVFVCVYGLGFVCVWWSVLCFSFFTGDKGRDLLEIKGQIAIL